MRTRGLWPAFLVLLLVALAVPAVAAAAGARDLFIRSSAIGSGWKLSGKVIDLPAKDGVQGTPQLSPATVSSAAARHYRRGKGLSRPLDLGATIGERSVGDQGTFGEATLHGRDVEERFKTACFLSSARVVCMTLVNRKGHGRPVTTVLRHTARAEAAKLAATP